MTHGYPPNRAVDSVSISRVSALRDYGLTQRQREFLVPSWSTPDVFWSGSTASSPVRSAVTTAANSWLGWSPAASPEPSSPGPSDVVV